MKILGIDPSLSNCGFVKADLNIDTGKFQVQSMKLCETSKTKIKSARNNSDDLARAGLISDELQRQLMGAQMVFVEVPHGSQSARAMASYGICIGILAGIHLPMIQLTANEVKLGSCGIKNATKVEMIDWAVSQHPAAPWLKRGGKIILKNEHLADAVGAIQAGLSSQDFLNAKAILRFAA